MDIGAAFMIIELQLFQSEMKTHLAFTSLRIKSQ